MYSFFDFPYNMIYRKKNLRLKKKNNVKIFIVTTPLRLKVIWQTNLLAIALDGSTPFITYFLSSYYFCPRTNVWEQLKLELKLICLL